MTPHRPDAALAGTWFPLLALGFAVAGADKLFGQRGYRVMFRHWGWSERRMRGVGALETLGGALLLARTTRPLGGAMLVATCAGVLQAELRHGEARHGVPRLGLLLAAATALLPRGTR